MTTRKELIQLAQQHAVPGTEQIITAIEEATTQLRFAATKLKTVNDTVKRAMEDDPYGVVGSFIPVAGEYDVAAGKLNTLFLTLACVLESNGIETGY